jgi:LysM repeat protein
MLRSASICAAALGTLSTVLQPASTFAAGSVAVAPAQYVVKPGDFLAGIAAKIGVALPDLLSVNNMTSKSLIMPGDKLAIPANAASPNPAASASGAPVAGAIVYTVKWGDFLLGIATQYKVTLADLVAVNKITTASVINPGRQLTLPANAVAPQVNAPAAGTAPAAGPAISTLMYTVKFGDFLAGIASSYKVTLPDLLAVNKLKPTSLIVPGTKLAMPVGAVAPAAPAAVSVASPDVQSSAGPVGIVVAYAYAQLGKPYRFFTAGPDTFDCSGLVLAAYSQIGIAMIHHAASQATYGTAVDIWSGDSILAGDLIFLATHGTPEINHVGIAVDATHWIQAPAPGDVVRLSSIPAKGLIATVRRIIPTADS